VPSRGKFPIGGESARPPKAGRVASRPLSKVPLAAEAGEVAGRWTAKRAHRGARGSGFETVAAGVQRAQPIAPLDAAGAAAFMNEVIDREWPFYRPGGGYDRATGVTFDGQRIDFTTGQVTGHVPFSAASKESLQLGLLAKVLEKDASARRLFTPDPKRPEAAVGRALEVLERKIATYERFDREYPGFGGFLPWYSVKPGRIEPTPDWQDRVPGLDNGQLAWSIYVTAHVLRDTGHVPLAQRYEAQLSLMKQNAVRIFYDPEAHKVRAEAKLERGARTPPARNDYRNNVAHHYLDDAFEGLLMCHFMDLFGDWSGHEVDREALWAAPRRAPIEVLNAAGQAFTIVRGNWFSSHEDWAFAVLPFRDLPVADALFQNAQKVRTWHSADNGIPGLFASTTRPVHAPGENAGYQSALGVPGAGTVAIESQSSVAPYAAFPLALVDKPLFATWLKTMLLAPRMWGPGGMGESSDTAGNGIAPVLTWDGKALQVLAWMGGLTNETTKYLKQDGLYDALMDRVRGDYRHFAGRPLAGTQAPLAAPTALAPRAMKDFPALPFQDGQ